MFRYQLNSSGLQRQHWQRQHGTAARPMRKKSPKNKPNSITVIVRNYKAGQTLADTSDVCENVRSHWRSQDKYFWGQTEETGTFQFEPTVENCAVCQRDTAVCSNRPNWYAEAQEGQVRAFSWPPLKFGVIARFQGVRWKSTYHVTW